MWVRPSNGLPFRPPSRRSLIASLIAYLLLTVESNPGPFDVRFGSWNAGSAVNKGALIEDLIRDNRLDVLAVCESGIRSDAPDAVKYDIAPPDFLVLHVHRPPAADTGRCRRGGGLSFIFSKQLSVRPLGPAARLPRSSVNSSACRSESHWSKLLVSTAHRRRLSQRSWTSLPTY